MGHGRTWTDEEIGLLESDKYTAVELAQMLGRTQLSVQSKRQKLRLVQERIKHSNIYRNGVCNMTCPEYCPYRDCKLSGAEILMYDSKNKKGAKA